MEDKDSFNGKKWEETFSFQCETYLQDADSAVRLLPLLFLYLRCKGQLDWEYNRPSEDDSNVLASFDFHDFNTYVSSSGNSLSVVEYERVRNGIKNWSLKAYVSADDPAFGTIQYFIQERNAYLREGGSYLKTIRKTYEQYRCSEEIFRHLNDAPLDWLKENYADIFMEVLRGSIFVNGKMLRNRYYNKYPVGLSELMLRLLDVQRGDTVVQPFADYGHTLGLLPEGCTYIPSYAHLLCKHLMVLQKASGRVNTAISDAVIPLRHAESDFDYLLWNDIGCPEKETAEEVLRIILYRSHHDNLKAACLIDNGFLLSDKYQPLLQYYLENNCVETVVFFRKGLVLVVFKPNETGYVRIVDETECREINSEDILQRIRVGVNTYQFTSAELKEMDFGWNLNKVLRQKPLVPTDGKKYIRLSSILSPIRLKGCYPGTWKKQPDFILSYGIHKFYTPYQPVFTAADTVPLTDELYFDLSEHRKRPVVLEERALVINLRDAVHHQPRIFDNRFGQTMMVVEPDDNIYIFAIDEKAVNVEYLVGEMNKDYFINQLYPQKQYYISCDTDTFLSAWIQVPDCPTSLERQKIMFRAEKLAFLKSLTQSFDYHADRIANARAKSLRCGTRLMDGRFQIVEPIGFGGFGKTYKAIDYSIPMAGNEYRYVAIKEFFVRNIQKRDMDTQEVVTPYQYTEEVELARRKFIHEVNKIRTFADNPHIVNVYESFDENGTCYYTMDYIEGLSLEDYVKSAENGRLSEEEACRIVRETGSALKAMHSMKMNHLDVKPLNIMIDVTGKSILIDFGTAHLFQGCKDGNSTLLAIASDRYSPLDIKNIEGFSPASDIYSLGATLYYMLTGHDTPPADALADGCDELERPSHLSDRIWEAIVRALNPIPHARPQSVDEFLSFIL